MQRAQHGRGPFGGEWRATEPWVRHAAGLTQGANVGASEVRPANWRDSSMAKCLERAQGSSWHMHREAGSWSARTYHRYGGGFHHDIFITEKYVGIIDGSMLFQPKNIVSSGSLWNFDPTAKLRFGFCSRSEELTAENFTWIEAPVPADVAHVFPAIDENPSKITLWCPLLEQGDDQETVLGDMGPLRMRRVDIDMNTRSVGIHKVSGTDDFDTEFPRFRDDRGCQRVRFEYSGLTRPGPDFNWHFEVGPPRHQLTSKLDSISRWCHWRGARLLPTT